MIFPEISILELWNEVTNNLILRPDI